MLLLSCDDISWKEFIGFKSAIEILTQKKDPLKAVEARICAVEDAGLDSVGTTGYPDRDGNVTLDAGLMSGQNLLSAGVGCLQGYQHPFLVAQELWKQQKKGVTPHNYLVGIGANKFADSVQAKKANSSEKNKDDRSPLTHDTVGCISWDGQDQWFVGTSTSGWGGKLPGRLGDSCTAGAGFCAFPKGAVFCTWTGEIATRFSLAARTAIYMEDGLSVDQAVNKALRVVAAINNGHKGPVIIHAASQEGCCVAGYGFEGGKIPATYTFWRDGMQEPVRRQVPLWNPDILAVAF
ncbi:MAG: isoaspartyl peptidase/L-asparaginase [Alphaproteobacteria bacterium]|nr:MAG: isoaspartyl peptidase/L-asparaginase [Alphaproteobacteria bacterium]